MENFKDYHGVDTVKKSEKVETSSRDEWETPEYLYDWLDIMYHFHLDVCASYENSKAFNYIGKESGSLEQVWMAVAAFCNPPYSNIRPWLKKGLEEVDNGNCKTVVYVLPQDLSSKWGKFAVQHASKIIFLVGGRVQFKAPYGIKSSSNPKGTMIVEFSKKSEFQQCTYECVDIKELTAGTCYV